ncbi:GlcG/HbpS family heme-binding protein [Hyphococcus sp.]|uniref:GlcG/HbpS family heme-binding protein n=1 Tax=Hyphococcus sp. TaxID=2038636 RepID=UPI003CCBD1D7
MITHDVSKKMVEAAIEKARELGIAGSVAVVNADGNMTAFLRMDGSLLGSADGAIRKANTAAVSGMSTSDWFNMFTDNAAFGQIIAHGTSGMLFLPGGLPVPGESGGPDGGVGFSGGAPDQDAQIVDAALSAISK